MRADRAGVESGSTRTGCISAPLCMCSARASSGTLCRARNSRELGRQWSTASFSSGPRRECSGTSGDAAWQHTMPWRASPGFGKRPTGRTSRPRLRRSPSGRTRRAGEKNGTKRSLLVDEHGVPLSLVVSGANRHDSISLEPLLTGAVAEPADENIPRNLCLDAAYVGKEEVVEANGFVPHVRPRG